MLKVEVGVPFPAIGISRVQNIWALRPFQAARIDSVADPCPDYATEGVTDKICEALKEGNLWTELGMSKRRCVFVYATCLLR